MTLKPTRSAGGIIMNKKSQIVLVHQKGSLGESWSFPKGRIEHEEDPLTAARREIYEETGLTELAFVKNLGEFEQKPWRLTGMKRKIVNIFSFTTNQEKLTVVDKNDVVQKAQWIEKENVAQTITNPEAKKFFEKILDQI